MDERAVREALEAADELIVGLIALAASNGAALNDVTKAQIYAWSDALTTVIGPGGPKRLDEGRPAQS